MITRSDLQKAGRDVMAERRRSLGEPPAAAEIEAYLRGELDPDQEERIRELLVAYPELARGIGADFPEDDPRPGEPGWVSDEEIARRLTALHDRMGTAPVHSERGRLLHFRNVPLALAAMLALVFAGLYWRSESRLRRMQDELVRPHAVSTTLLRRGGQRGGDQATTLENPPADVQQQLSIPMTDAMHYDAYEVDINKESGEVLWTIQRVRREDDFATIVIPHNALPSGRYTVSIFGISGRTRELIDRFSIRMP
jgi:hypothetical protein